MVRARIGRGKGKCVAWRGVLSSSKRAAAAAAVVVVAREGEGGGTESW